MDVYSLLKNTNAYKIFHADKARGTLSHAYLIVSEDKLFLENYLKIVAKVLVCSEKEPCNRCRVCSLVDKKSFTDDERWRVYKAIPTIPKAYNAKIT